MAISKKGYENIEKGLWLHKKDFTRAIADITWREREAASETENVQDEGAARMGEARLCQRG